MLVFLRGAEDGEFAFYSFFGDLKRFYLLGYIITHQQKTIALDAK
jgi:hypothetical protein